MNLRGPPPQVVEVESPSILIMEAFCNSFKTTYLIWVATLFLNVANSFSLFPGSGRTFVTLTPARPRSRVTSLQVTADPPMKDDKKRQGGDRDFNNDEAWIPGENGGFFPNFRGLLNCKQRSEPNMESRNTTEELKEDKVVEVVDIQQYKVEVADVHDTIVCVRFYAPWCKSCKAIEAKFRRLPREFSGYPVKFVECPVTKDNAYLHKGLEVPSLPYGHIYHPEAGLVEELKINKNVFAKFKNVLRTYAQGECPISFDDHGSCIPR